MPIRVSGGMGVQPPIPRLMAYIDGENLVARYQAMLAGGATPKSGVKHKTDAYVWYPEFRLPGHFEAVRATYYTSVVGDEGKIESIAEELRALPFAVGGFAPIQCLLYPQVFKRPSSSPKTSIADVQLVVDALSQVYQGNVDTLILLSGDGDFRALVDEVARRGRRIYVGAFSSGRHPDVAKRADRFIDLDTVFFEQQPG